MKQTEKILEAIAAKDRPVSLKEIDLGISPSALSGFLSHLCKTKKLTREKMERVDGNGPKTQWFYKTVANPQQTE